MTFLTKKRQIAKGTTHPSRKASEGKEGFTLIELLVVIAIIGVLASIVLASLNTARLKSRDTRRVADMNQIKLALQLYYDSYRAYPDVAAGIPSATNFIPTFIGTWPIDPIAAAGNTGYTYFAALTSAGTAAGAGLAQFFHTGAGVEDRNIAAMNSDADRCPDALGICAPANGATTVMTGTTIHGTDSGSDCSLTAAAATRGCYDVTP